IRHDVFSRLAELYRYDIGEEALPPRAPILLPARHINAQAASQYQETSLEMSVNQQASALQGLDAACVNFWKANSDDYLGKGGGHFWTWDGWNVQIGPVPFETGEVDGHTRPLVVLTGSAGEIPVHLQADRLHFLGNVTAPDGYPTRGKLGEEMGSYTIAYSDIERQQVPLRWCFEVSRGNLIASATHLNPVVLAATPAVNYVKEFIWVQCRTLLF